MPAKTLPDKPGMAERRGKYKNPDYHIRVFLCLSWEKEERRGWDSNPRWPLQATTVFETAPIGHSGTPPWIDGIIPSVKNVGYRIQFLQETNGQVFRINSR